MRGRTLKADRRVQAAKLFVVSERKVDVHALEVRPSVPAAIEDTVERGIDLSGFMGPEPRFGLRIHPGVHGRRQQTRPVLLEEGIDADDVRVKGIGERSEVVGRPVGLQLDDMEDQLVGPREPIERDLARSRGGDFAQKPVGDRPDIEGLPVDDHSISTPKPWKRPSGYRREVISERRRTGRGLRDGRESTA